MLELLVVIPISSLFVWKYFMGSKSCSEFSTQTEPGIWLPIIDCMDLDLDETFYDSQDDVEMTPVDSKNIMTYKDYCA